MEVPVYKEQGDRLYKIFNNIIIELDLSSYEHGIIGCNTADVRTCLILPNNKAKVIKPAKFNKYYKQFVHFVNKANEDTGGTHKCQSPLMPPCKRRAADRLTPKAKNIKVNSPKILANGNTKA